MAFAIALVIGAGCKFEPSIASGNLTCGAHNECPKGHVCSAARLCCVPGDPQPQCAPATIDVTAPGRPTDDARAAGGDPGDGGGGAAGNRDSGSSPADAPGTGTTPARRPPVRVVTGQVDLMADFNACGDERTHAMEDRWCGFTRGSELWVVNVSQALRTQVRCDGTDPACLLMTKTFAPFDPKLFMDYNGFWGDLLIFAADAKPPGPDGAFRGGIYAWYPGWPRARRLTSENGFRCSGAMWAPAAWCLDRPVPGQRELSVGFLTPDGPPLTPVKRVSESDHLFARITWSGKELVVQHNPQTLTPGPLWLVPTATAADPATHVLIDKAVSYFQFGLSGDSGLALYYLRGTLLAPRGSPGTLVAVDMQDPTHQFEMATMVNDFRPVRGVDDTQLGVAALQNVVGGAGVLKVFIGLLQFKELTIGTTSSDFVVSRDGRFTFFQPVQDPATGRRDARVANHAASSVCALQKVPRTRPNLLYSFSDNGELVFWEEFPDATQVLADGWMARSQDCSAPHKFGARIAYWRPLRNAGLLYLDDFTTEGTLRVAQWDPGFAWPAAGPTTLQEHVRPYVAALYPGPDLPFRTAVYSSHEPGREGLYVAELPQ